MFVKLKDFPKIHGIDILLKELSKVYGRKKEINKFIRENANIIGDLNQAYITARYLPVEFNFYQVKKMEKFVRALIKFLKKICPKL